MQELLKHIGETPVVVLVVIAFLWFTLKLIELGINTVGKARENKEKKADIEAGGGVTHLTIFERLGTHHALLEAVDKKVDTLQSELHEARDSLHKLENDFRLHTQSDTDIARSFIKRLDRLDEKIDALGR